MTTSTRANSSGPGCGRPHHRGVLAAAAVLLAVTCAFILGTATGAYADGNNSGTIRINVTVPQAGPGGGNPGNPGGSGGGSGGLPKTGADLIGLFVVAAALVGGGVTLTVVARRRRHG